MIRQKLCYKAIILGLILLSSCDKIHKNENIRIFPKGKVKSLNELMNLNELKSKVLYINIWTPGSEPCLEEFARFGQLKKQLSDHEIKFIFITPRGNRQWEKTIYQYDVEGWHIQSIELIKDVLKNTNQLYQYPILLLAAKDRTITRLDIRAPYRVKERVDQIKKLL